MEPISEKLPPIPALVVGPGGGAIISRDGRVRRFSLAEAARAIGDQRLVVVGAPMVARQLGFAPKTLLDALELFCFIRPAEACVPTPAGLARALGLDAPGVDLETNAVLILDAVGLLLRQCRKPEYRQRAGAYDLVARMTKAGWGWGPYVQMALGAPPHAQPTLFGALPEWQTSAPPPPPRSVVLTEDQVLQRLEQLVGADAEQRLGQRAYALAAMHGFAPRLAEGAPHVALLEAGTGIGKTLGYVAAASLWAQLAGGAVWLATYTKALQRQVDQQLDRLYPDPKTKAGKVVLRKGRENYLCLLNLDEATTQATLAGLNDPDAILLGLVERWARFSRDGDLVGGDFPSFLGALFGPQRLGALTDHRGECLYSSCRHWRRCFIEKNQRAAAHAEIVVANHALVMINAARGREEAPTRYVFDEAHHLFDAADGVFSAYLSGQEMAELRRWLLGAEGRRRGRGLALRIGELLGGEEAQAALEQVLDTASTLPAEGWLTRLRDGGAHGPAERLLGAIKAQVFARVQESRGDHGLECDVDPPAADLIEAARELDEKLGRLARPLGQLVGHLHRMLEDQAGEWDGDERARIDGASRMLEVRLESSVKPWRAMLARLGQGAEPGVVDWFEVERIGGRLVDAGMRRHLIDPSEPFAKRVLGPAHGALITSATLRDRSEEQAPDQDWRMAEVRTGGQHLLLPPKRFSVASPFDYATQTRLLVVGDVNKHDSGAVAGAYRALFEAAGGGGLGLFTAIARLRAVHARIAQPLFEAGLALYAQHVDPIDISSLVDIFRAEENACLLGTDAVRDGIDVPGRSLRLIVFDRIPWPRPSLLHRERRAAFGERRYDDLIARLRLTQAYGRLVRRASDHGVFVMLDGAAPSRLFSGLAPGVAVERVGLAEAVAITREFLR